MSESRANILGRLRAAPPAALPPVPPPAAPRGWDRAERLERFTACQRLVSGEVHVTTRDAWPYLLRGLLSARGVRTLACGEDTAPLHTLAAAWAEATDVPSLLAPSQIDDWKAGLFSIDAGLTTTRCGIAETGSLVLWPDRAEPRLLSLVPPIHIAVLDGAKLYETFDEVIAAEAWAAQGLPTNAVLVSGPSKTADIEQTLAYGVHGPKELIVLVLDDTP